MGCHKSGTSLLRSLLDGHPELAVLPTEAHFFGMGGYWMDYGMPSRRAPRTISAPADVKSVCLAHARGQNEERDPHGNNYGFAGYDLDRFSEHFWPQQLRSPGQVMAQYLNALWDACSDEPGGSGRRIVEKSVEQAEFAPILKTWYPDAKFVHIVRNPYATFSGIRRWKQKKWYPYLRPIVQALNNSYYYLIQNPMHLGESYLTLRYEDLVADPGKAMRRVASFLGITVTDGLTTPTLQGRPWASNSTTTVGVSRVERSPSEAWRRDINPLEIELVNRISPVTRHAFGYQTLSPPRTPLWPVPKERPRTYLRNRALLEASRDN
jgi:hypothetical protein